jgi:hypothetical protein
MGGATFFLLWTLRTSFRDANTRPPLTKGDCYLPRCRSWFRSLDELCTVALRRFLESHREDLMEAFIRQDVEWGLTGDE